MSADNEFGEQPPGTRLFNRAKRVIEQNATWLISTEAILFYILLYVPILVVIALSFNDSQIAVSWQGFTLKWYAQILSGEGTRVVNPSVAQTALENTVLIALVSTGVSVVFGTLLAIGLDRYNFSGKRALNGVVYMPIIMPSIIMGISALVFFHQLDISTGLGTTMIAHIVFNISFVTVIVYARLQSFDRTLEEAANDLGADNLETFRYVTLPLISPGIIAGGLLAFALSFDDFVITYFVIGTEKTLPVYFFSMVRQGIAPGVNVIASLIVITVMLLVFLAQYITSPDEIA